jgi:regulation of enolase protein 1 (concanavalin A-like superfamily)
MLPSFTLPTLPASLTWHNTPLQAVTTDPDQLTITAGAETDWFLDPAGSYVQRSAPVALFVPPDENLLLSAQVTVGFGSIFDAGVLFVYRDAERWAKLCFELSPQRQPMIVAVVTRGVSDDSNAVPITGPSVFLRIHRRGEIFAFHYSLDQQFWVLVRYFTLGRLDTLSLGFSAQSPTGQRCTATFAQISYQPGLLADLRNGE